MNIFGVGGWELILVILIALIVAGPKRMAHWAYIAGGYIGQLRIAWRNMMTVVQKEFDDAGVDIKVPKDIPNRSDINRFAGQLTEPLAKSYRETVDEMNDDLREVKEVASMKNMSNRSKTTANGRADGYSNGNNAQSFGTWTQNDTGTTPTSSLPTTDEDNFGTWTTSTDDDETERRDDNA